MTTINVSPEFRSKALRCILAIIAFILVYFLLLGLAFATVYYTGLLALTIVSLSINFLTIILGLGLVAMGVLLVIFLLKFLFQTNEAAESNDVEITRAEEPALFELIDEVVSQLDVKPPKKVFLAPDVNASVFYNSSFWSMFFPVRKNLRIGLGLMNSLNREELRAVIAHEFGHFSQRSMAVGSYVYTVNQVIFNLVNNDESFNNLAGQIASVSAYVYPCVWVAMKAVQGVRWVLAQMYKVVNLSYLGLSREMEYHADAVAAALGGGHGLASGLRRIDLASNSYQQAVNFAGEQLSSLRRVPNIYSLQTDKLLHVAEKDKLELRGKLPLVEPGDTGRYLKSKVEIGQQWASHPEVEDRIAHLELPDEVPPAQDAARSIELLNDPENAQRVFTNNLLLTFNRISDCTPLTDAEALALSRQQQAEQDLPPVFNGYFDNHNFMPRAIDPNDDGEPIAAATLFANERVANVDRLLVLNYDIALITAIKDKQVAEKTFDYEGKKYRRREAAGLLEQLQKESATLTAEVTAFDWDIIISAVLGARAKGREEELQASFTAFQEVDARHGEVTELTQALRNEGTFMQYNMNVNEIQGHMVIYQRKVDLLKEKLNELLDNTVFKSVTTSLILEEVAEFTEQNLKLFNYDHYNERAVNALMTNIPNAEFIANRGYLAAKRKMLVLMSEVLG
ncbi:MAG: M48 family metallopeptidase [Bacteroidota bacterium]